MVFLNLDFSFGQSVTGWQRCGRHRQAGRSSPPTRKSPAHLVPGQLQPVRPHKPRLHLAPCRQPYTAPEHLVEQSSSSAPTGTSEHQKHQHAVDSWQRYAEAYRRTVKAHSAGSSAVGGTSEDPSPLRPTFTRPDHLTTLASLSSVSISTDALSSVDEYGTDSSTELDFTDLAEDEKNSITESKEPGAAPYAKATYEVLRLDASGRARRFYARRRDMLREYRLQPRDLRRIDPSVDFTKTSPSITIKEDVLLLNLGGVRAITTSQKALLFEPTSATSRKFLELVLPRLQAHTEGAGRSAATSGSSEHVNASHSEYMARYYPKEENQRDLPPFELEVLEGALMVATGRLDAEMLGVSQRVSTLLTRLPADINPMNLEELRRVKQALVEVEDKADTLREMLEELMDDEDELRELNLSSRPRREDRRRQRERTRLERELERAREIKEELEERVVVVDGQPITPAPSITITPSVTFSTSSGTPLVPPFTTGGIPNSNGNGTITGQPMTVNAPYFRSLPGLLGTPHTGITPSKPNEPVDPGKRQSRLKELRAKHNLDKERLSQLRAQVGAVVSAKERGLQREREGGERDRERDRDRRRDRDDAETDWINRLGDSEEDLQEAQDALEEMVEEEEEEGELEEVEDLLEYYLQRASAIHGEAERMLAGARDMEESIGVSLSARRYEVNRLELMLSIGSFAAAVGACIAGIFGMNMKSTLEMSTLSFWGVSVAIVLGCAYIFFAIMRYTRNKRIL